MSQFSQDELDAFLVEAQLVNQKVKALAQDRITVEELDLIEKKKINEAKKKQDLQRKKQQQKLQEKKRGKSGKGITKDFLNFCRSCHLQYEFQTPECLRCKKKTLTLEQRQKQLEGLVENYRLKKSRKQARRQKWQMWKKTKAMLPTQLSTQYDKWQAYTSSQQQQQTQEPILPKDDPNFKALQMDLIQRKKRKQESNKKADSYKQKGNKLMAQKKYQQAADCYSLALQEVKDNKILYTNRALAYIKLGKWQRAIKDCTTVIQYMQCFQKLDEIPDLAFKAFSRRALAHKQRKQYSKSLDDIVTSLKYNSKDEAALRLKAQIENFIKYQEKSSELLKNTTSIETLQEKQQQFSEKDIIRQLAQKQQQKQQSRNEQTSAEKRHDGQEKSNVPTQPVERIKYFIKNLSNANIQSLLNMLISQNQLKSVFIKLEGIKNLLQYIEEQQDRGKSVVLLSFMMDGSGVAEKQVWDHNIHKFENKCIQIITSELKMKTYSELQDYFQIFIALSLNEKYRLLLSESLETINFMQKCYPVLITKFKKQPEVLNAFIVYLSNLCKGDTKIKVSISSDIKTIVESLERVLSIQSKNKKVHQLQKSIYILISNLVTNSNFKEQVISNTSLLKICVGQLKSFPKSSQIYQNYIQSILSVFVNLLYQPSQKILYTLSNLGLQNVIYQRFIGNKHNQTLLRSLNILSKLDYKNKEQQTLTAWMNKIEKYFRKQDVQRGTSVHVLRFLNNVFMTHKDFELPKNIQSICHLLNSDNQILFCNTCNLLGLWTDNPKNSQRAYLVLRQYIPHLVNIAKQKTGNLRKSSAILLAKIARDPESKEIFLANHGMDVLKSIATFVLDKK